MRDVNTFRNTWNFPLNPKHDYLNTTSPCDESMWNHHNILHKSAIKDMGKQVHFVRYECTKKTIKRNNAPCRVPAQSIMKEEQCVDRKRLKEMSIPVQLSSTMLQAVAEYPPLASKTLLIKANSAKKSSSDPVFTFVALKYSSAYKKLLHPWNDKHPSGACLWIHRNRLVDTEDKNMDQYETVLCLAGRGCLLTKAYWVVCVVPSQAHIGCLLVQPLDVWKLFFWCPI